MYKDSKCIMGSPQKPRPTPASLFVTSVQIIAPVQSPVESFVHHFNSGSDPKWTNVHKMYLIYIILSTCISIKYFKEEFMLNTRFF